MRCRAFGSLTDWKMGSCSNSGSPGKYIWVMSLLLKASPNSEKCMCAGRQAYIHFSLFGEAFRSRLITQMYFPGDPLFEHDPIFQSVRDPKARQRMISTFDLETTQPEWALGYRFDIVLEGRAATPMENHR